METELSHLTVRIIFNEEMRPDRFFVRSPQQHLNFEAIDSSLQNYFKNPNMDRFDADGSSPQLQNNDVMACYVEDRYFRCKFLGIEENMPNPSHAVKTPRTLCGLRISETWKVF